MSGVIKAALAETSVRTIGAGLARRGVEQAPAIPSKSATELALDEAHEEISKLQTALIDARDQADNAAQSARETGKEEGRREAQDDAKRRLASIEKGVDLARIAWNDKLAGLETLAVMLAHSALSKVFGEDADLADLVTRAIGLRVQALRTESIVAIRVSARDFPDADALELLRANTGTRSVDIVIDSALESGDCRLDLQLGHVDLGVRSQWCELDRFLGMLVAEKIDA